MEKTGEGWTKRTPLQSIRSSSWTQSWSWSHGCSASLPWRPLLLLGVHGGRPETVWRARKSISSEQISEFFPNPGAASNASFPDAQPSGASSSSSPTPTPSSVHTSQPLPSPSLTILRPRVSAVYGLLSLCPRQSLRLPTWTTPGDTRLRLTSPSSGIAPLASGFLRRGESSTWLRQWFKN